jgi:hypothetical protein
MLLTTTLLTTLLALAPTGTLAADCSCKHNTDAGRWKDNTYSPSAVLGFLNKQNGGCYEGSGQGKICVFYSGDNGGEVKEPFKQKIHDCVFDFSKKEESYHNDWFLWTNSECEIWEKRSGALAKLASGKVTVIMN